MTRRHRALWLGALLGGMVLALCSAPAWSEDTVLKTEAFGTLRRPVAIFDHDSHNEKAGLDDCATCHHVYQNGKLVKEASSEDQACSDCHPLKGQGRQPGLREAYHGACVGCHKSKGKGPVACGQCHQR